MSQQISAVGTIATAPKLFTPEGGAQFCTFRLASTERRFDAGRNAWVDGDTNWFTVNAFRSLAFNAQQSFSRGDRVVVSGRLRVRPWESEERRGISVEIDADAVGHDVRWGVSSFARSPVTAAPTPQVAQDPAAGADGGGGGGASGIAARAGDTGGLGDADGAGGPGDAGSAGAAGAAAEDSKAAAGAEADTTVTSADGFTPRLASA